MKKTSTTSRPVSHALGFRLQPVAAGCALLLLGTAQLAQAQQATQEVTVTGIRRGIEAAISVKKNADGIVEAISAEDIGKLPDNSIAESIARLPGLSAQRVAGRAQVISVRGLSPDFATTLLNGREVVSTGDNRSVEFDQYPSELLSGVVIYKTPYADLVGQGLSGTLDMQTVRPLNFSNRVIAVNARYQQNSLGAAANAKDNGNRISASYIDQFANRTVGIALGFAHQESPVQENQVGFYEPWKQVDNTKTDFTRPGLANGSWLPDGLKALRRTGVTKRDGLMATVELKANKDWTSTLDLFASKATQEDTANQWEMNLQYNGNYPCNPQCAFTSPTYTGGNAFASGTVTGVYPLVRGMYNKRDDEIKAAGWKNEFKLGGVAMVADVNYSKATRNETSLENNSQLVPAPQYDTVGMNFRSGDFSSFRPTLSYADPTKLFLRGTIYGSGYGKTPRVEDELTGLKLGAKFPTSGAVGSLFADVDVGLNYADRSKKKRQPEGNINVGKQGDTAIAADLQYAPVNLGFAGLGTIPAWNVPGAVGRYMTFNPSETAAAYLIAKAWNVFEKTATGYVQGNIDTNWGGTNVRGNLGVQVVRTDQSSTSNYWDGTAPAGKEVKPFSDGKTSTDVLPSLNLAFDLGNDQTVRFAAAQQMARPRVDQLRSSLDFGVDAATGRPGASGGNPRLDPWKANALDLSYEKYFGTRAYVAAAGFYKDLKSYIYTQGKDYDYSQFIAGYVPKPGNPPAQKTGTLTAPYNGQGGKLQGLELSASLPFNLLAPSLQGFGVVASVSITNSNVKIKDPESANSVGSGEIALPGLSKNVSNLTVYYENRGFEARISQRKRSDYIGEIGNFNGARTLRYVVGESVVDAQLAYNFNEGSFKGLGVLLQVNNLTNEGYQTYAGTKDRPLEYIKWGKTVLLGANYKF